MPCCQDARLVTNSTWLERVHAAPVDSGYIIASS